MPRGAIALAKKRALKSAIHSLLAVIDLLLSTCIRLHHYQRSALLAVIRRPAIVANIAETTKNAFNRHVPLFNEISGFATLPRRHGAHLPTARTWPPHDPIPALPTNLRPQLPIGSDHFRNFLSILTTFPPELSDSCGQN
jgi:hypothetical protein